VADKEEIGTALMVAGVFVAFVAIAFPQQVASGLATVVVDTSPPDVNAMNPSGSKSNPTHFDPDATVTLKMNSFREKVNNARVVIDGSTKSLSYSGSSGTPYGTEYYYTTSWSTSGHSGEKLSFTFKGEDDAGNTGSDTAYALIGSYADGYFTINGQKLSKGGKITISTRSIDLKFTKTTSATPDEVWYTVRDSNGNWLQKKSDTVKTSSPWTWSYTFPSDGTYEVNGYCKSYGKSVQVMSFRTGVNTSPVPQLPFPSEAMIVLGTGIAIATVGGVLRFKPEMF